MSEHVLLCRCGVESAALAPPRGPVGDWLPDGWTLIDGDDGWHAPVCPACASDLARLLESEGDGKP